MPHLGINAIDHVVTLLRWLAKRWPKLPVHAARAAGAADHEPRARSAAASRRTWCRTAAKRRSICGRVPGQDHDAIVQRGPRHGGRAGVHHARVCGWRSTSATTSRRSRRRLAHPLIRHAAEAVEARRRGGATVRGATYYTDGGMWVGTGIPMVIFGPGRRQASASAERARACRASRPGHARLPGPAGSPAGLAPRAGDLMAADGVYQYAFRQSFRRVRGLKSTSTLAGRYATRSRPESRSDDTNVAMD